MIIDEKDLFMSRFRGKFIGDRDFYAMVLALVVPMILQNVITNFVSMLDNIMVGQIGTEQMSGVSIVNQFIFIFNITIFGAVSGPSIFGSQFFGKGDHEGQKYSFRFRLIVCAAIVAVFYAVFTIFMEPLISLYLSADDAPEVVASTLNYAKEYMTVVLLSIVPFGISQAYASVERECGHTQIPMYGALTAVGINLVLDYGLIFGKFGLPELGVVGAAWATVVAEWIEAAVIIIWGHANPQKNKYIIGVFRHFSIPWDLTKQMVRRSWPLLINEFLWVIGMSVIAQCYSVRGLEVVAARNIASTITNLFGVVYIQMGACISIIVGARLGAGDHAAARDMDNKLLFFATAAGAVVGLCMLPFSSLFPLLYNTEDTIRTLASYIIIVTAFGMPMWSYTNACYFTLRSGGRTGITFLFDFVFTWAIQIPLCVVLCYFTSMDFHLLLILVTFAELIKVVIGYFMVRSDMWVKTIVS